MAEFFVGRPIVAMVIAIIMVIVGVVAMQSLPIADAASVPVYMTPSSSVYVRSS